MSSLIWTVSAQSSDPELDAAITWMYTQWLTKYSTVSEYRPSEPLTREQAAKFFSEFAVGQLSSEEIIDAWSCTFNDIWFADKTLVPSIESACLLWLFKWSWWSFKPFDQITKAEALTVLIRALTWFEDESVTPRWYNYHKEARQLWLTREENVLALDRPITRYEVALILFRARVDDTTPSPTKEEADLQLQELLGILQELWLRTE